MNLEFKVYELESKTNFGKILERQGIKELIVIGIEKINNIPSYKAHDIKNGPLLIKGLSILDTAFVVPKEDLKLKGDEISHETCELDIPKEYLSMEIIEEIQRLNK